MRKVFAGWVVLLGWSMLAGSVSGQEVTGVFSITGTAGYQSNPYLDPVLGEWDPNVAPAFLAFDPRVGVTYTTPALQLGLTGMARTYPRRVERDVLHLVRINGSGRYAVAPAWTAGLNGGISRYRLRAERDAWWILPTLEWRPGRRTNLELQGGAAGRHTLFPVAASPRQTSFVGVLRGATWLSSRWHARLSVYLSDGHTTTGETNSGGTGLTAAATYWWTDRLALTGHAGFERISYEITQAQEAGSGPPNPIGGAPAGGGTTTVTSADRLWQAGAEVRWTLRSRLTLFTRVQGMIAHLDPSDTPSVDGHVDVGLRWRFARALAGARQTPQSRGLWHNAEEGVRFDVRYEGPGQLYVSGDFNNWADPGVPLRQTQPNRFGVTLPLRPGRYEYRIRIVTDEGTQWLGFPDQARTVRDGFGGVNGVCIVE